VKIANPTKAFLLLVSLICITGLIISGRVLAEAGLPIITYIVGYGVGNGIGAKNGDNAPQIFSRKDDDQ
jgi:hypothetical protein